MPHHKCDNCPEVVPRFTTVTGRTVLLPVMEWNGCMGQAEDLLVDGEWIGYGGCTYTKKLAQNDWMEYLENIAPSLEIQSLRYTSRKQVNVLFFLLFLLSIPPYPAFPMRRCCISAFGPIVDVTNKVIFGQGQRRSGI